MSIQRRKSRELALKVLYQNQFLSDSLEKILKITLPELLKENPLSEQEVQYCQKILKSFYENKESIDKLITTYSSHWKHERIAFIDLNIMRISILEMLYHPEIPKKVSLNEALELSKVFGSKNSPSFINGILDKVLKSS